MKTKENIALVLIFIGITGLMFIIGFALSLIGIALAALILGVILMEDWGKIYAFQIPKQLLFWIGLVAAETGTFLASLTYLDICFLSNQEVILIGLIVTPVLYTLGFISTWFIKK